MKKKKEKENELAPRPLNKHHNPDFAMQVYLVEYGYQVDYFINGQHTESECRDFGGNYPVRLLVADLNKRAHKMIEEYKAKK